MYLHLLNREEKETFLELAYYAALCDKKFSDIEKSLVKRYRAEMRLFEHAYIIKGKKLQEIISSLQLVSSWGKVAILLELIGLILSDLDYNEKEQELLDRIRNIWNVSDRKFAAMVRWYKKMKQIHRFGQY